MELIEDQLLEDTSDPDKYYELAIEHKKADRIYKQKKLKEVSNWIEEQQNKQDFIQKLKDKRSIYLEKIASANTIDDRHIYEKLLKTLNKNIKTLEKTK